jgi:NitT/TauT family transport system substrate-binding protein
MSNLRPFRAIRALTLLVTSLGLMAGPGHADDIKIKALVPAKLINEAFSPVSVAKYLGYFSEEGLDVSLIAVGGSNEVALAISTGAGDVGLASPGQALVGMQSPQALDLKYFYEANYRSIWTVTVAPDSPIKSIKDLKGKRIGMAAMGSAALTFGKALAAEAGLDPVKDVAFIAVGSGAQAIGALNHKAVDALIFSSQETSKFEANGFKIRYLDTGEGFASLPDVGILSRREAFTDNPKMLIGFARAVAKGYVFSVANPAAAVKISWKLFPESEPKNISPEEALKGGIMVNTRRMEIWDSPKTGGVYGKFIEADWKRLIDYMKTNGILREELPLDHVLTNALIPEINSFDREKIRKQAKAFDLVTMK